jgi:hypothetical protein
MRRPRGFMAEAGVVRLSRLGICCFVCGSASVVAAGGLAVTAAAATSTPNLIVNGTFTGNQPFRAANAEPGGSFKIRGWVVGTNGVQDMATSFITAPPGVNQSVRLYLNGEGTITQTVKTVPGTTYLLQWYGAGEPNGPAPYIKTMHVLWNGSDVASPNYSAAGETLSNVSWTKSSVVVAATATSSTVQFADDSPNAVSSSSMVTDVSLAADANLYVPHSASLSPTGKLTAIVHNGKGAPLTVSGLTVTLRGSWKAASYAPATTQLIASAPVVNGQALLQLKLPSSLKGQTITATATLTGPNYIPVTVKIPIKIT